MTFPYRPYTVQPVPGSQETVIYRPVIPVTLIGAHVSIFFGLLDSGADQTIINEDVAQLLQIPISNEPAYSMLTPGGEVVVPSARLKLAIYKPPQHYTWTITVGVVSQAWPHVLLGHSGFLEFFDVTLRAAAHEIIIKRNRQPF